MTWAASSERLLKSKRGSSGFFLEVVLARTLSKCCCGSCSLVSRESESSLLALYQFHRRHVLRCACTGIGELRCLCTGISNEERVKTMSWRKHYNRFHDGDNVKNTGSLVFLWMSRNRDGRLHVNGNEECLPDCAHRVRLSGCCDGKYMSISARCGVVSHSEHPVYYFYMVSTWRLFLLLLS